MAASNDAELAAMLKPTIMQALQITGDELLKPQIEIVLSNEFGGGSMYQANGAGSVSQAWKTETNGSGELGESSTQFDNSMLSFGDGRHEGAYSGEKINNMMALLDEGPVGMLFGFDNPARWHEGIWNDLVLEMWEESGYDWVRQGLESVGLEVL